MHTRMMMMMMRRCRNVIARKPAHYVLPEEES